MPGGSRPRAHLPPPRTPLYLTTPYGQVHAVDAASGRRLWRFDADLPRDRHYSDNTSRGVSAWRNSAAAAGTPCAVTIFFGTLDARLMALDAATGEPCRSFGAGGTVDLNEGSRPRDPGDYLVSSPPVVWGDLVITGSAIGDNRAVDVELGIVRAFDAQSGTLVWSWDPIPRSPGHPLYAEWGETAARQTGAANAWSVLSLDSARGLVSVPVGSPSPDYYGGERPGDNRHGNSLVALEAATGRVVWARQLVHHDVWDYDLPAQPVLTDLVRNGTAVPAVIQATKMGMLFVFHRETGEPLFGVEERPVPQGGVPGETLSPTQPFSAIPPLVPHDPLTGDDAWGLTFWDRGKCAEQIERSHRARAAGGGARVRRLPGIRVRPSDRHPLPHAPAAHHLTPRHSLHPASLGHAGRGEPRQWHDSMGSATRHLARPRPVAVLVHRRRAEHRRLHHHRRRSGLHRRRRRLPAGVRRRERPGAVARPAGGQATPMSYLLNGRQYVVIAAGGHGGLGTTRGDHLLAFALPEDRLPAQ